MDQDKAPSQNQGGKLQPLVRFAQVNLPRWVKLLVASALILASAESGFSVQSQGSQPEEVRSEIPYQDGTVILTSDFQERMTETRYHAKGHVVITFQDQVLTGDEGEYDEETGEGYVAGHTHFSQKQQWLSCSRAEFNFNTKTGVFYDATGYTDRQFLITGRTIFKTGADTYRIQDGYITACREKRPKWSFVSAHTNLQVDRTARMHKIIFKIKGIPVFYAPYLIVPMEKKERSSGLVPFHTGTSTTKGRVFSDGYYQAFGNSADLLAYGDYFSLRGLALGGIFRIKPNPDTHFTLEAYGIHDKLGQGGVQLTVDGVSLLNDDWRAVARINISSSFVFRQAFADSFRSATVPQELATAFLTRDYGSFSTNIAFERDEVEFPVRDLVVWKVPSLEYFSMGTPIGNSPFIFNLRASFDGMSRTDSLIATQGFTPRLDLYPRLTLRLPSFKGFSLVPSVGVRETYYGAQLSEGSPSGVANQSLFRRYADLNVELRTPVLERNFSSSWLGDFQHTVEPFVTYRWIEGIKDLDKTIRFDEEDAIADTNEVEYGIVNRFFKNRQLDNTGAQEKYQFMSFALVGKYYFDPTFGGAFKPGLSNSFYPLDTATGFYQTGIESNIAPVSAIFQLIPKNGIQDDIQADFDPKLKRFRNETLSTLWHRGLFFLSGTYLRIPQVETEADLPTGNQIQGQIGYGSMKSGLSSSITLSYNIQTHQLLNSNTRLSYVWDCCSLGVEFTQYNIGVLVESKFNFSFTLKGLGSFGDMKHPQSLF
jgi:LPS-assembly protein